MPNWSILSNGINASVPYGDITALVLDITIVPNATYSIVPSSFIIGEAIFYGLSKVIRNFKQILKFK